MKKIMMTLALGLAAFSQAQNTGFAAKAGLNTSSIKGDLGFGLYLGGAFRYKLNDKVSLQPELLYSYNNGNYNYSDRGIMSITASTSTASNSQSQEYRYSYQDGITYHAISIPLMLNYHITPKFSLSAGPQINFTFGDSNTVKFTSREIGGGQLDSKFSFSDKQVTLNTGGASMVTPIDFKPKSVSLALNLGATYDINPKVFLDARCSIGLTSFVENANVLANPMSEKDVISGQVVTLTIIPDTTKKDVSLSNTNVQFGIGYRF